MKLRRMRLSAGWVVVAVILVGIMAVMAVIERRERLRSRIAIERARTTYRDARRAREQAETAVNEYADGTFRRELASVEDEIKEAEDDLKRVGSATDAVVEWAERIRSKGYLLLVRGVPSKELAVKKAAFAIEQAKSKKHVLEAYAKFKILEKLNNLVAKATEDELAKQAAYDSVRAIPVCFIGKVIRRK